MDGKTRGRLGFEDGYDKFSLGHGILSFCEQAGRDDPKVDNVGRELRILSWTLA